MDTATRWWLRSGNNKWKDSNQYTKVTFYGNRHRAPWADPDGAGFIGNELRDCQYVGLGMSWNGEVPWKCGQLHVITAWGDEGPDGGYRYPSGVNPSQVKVTDSDDLIQELGQDVRTYTYDDYNNPLHPEGPGWYLIDYTVYLVKPYIMNVTTLCEADDVGVNTVTVVGSYRIHQDDPRPATDLHYVVGNNEHYRILDYETTIDWNTVNEPVVIPNDDPPTELTVTWNLSDNPVPQCNLVTITTQLVLPAHNEIYYEDVYFTYPTSPQNGVAKPSFNWRIDTPAAPDPDACWACGGFVVGAFDLYSDEGCTDLVGEYGLQHEYTYDQDPERE